MTGGGFEIWLRDSAVTLDADGHNREERSWGRKGGRGKVEEKEYGVLVAEAAEEERNGRRQTDREIMGV